MHEWLFFLMHGGPPPKALHQSGLTTRRSVHGKPKFTEDSAYCTQFQTQVRVTVPNPGC